MTRRAVAATVVVSSALAACTAPASVERAVEDAFVACADEQGLDVEDVEVRVSDDRSHIRGFGYRITGGGDDEVAERCEDTALAEHEVSRT